MCGIIGYIAKEKISDAGQRIIEQYQDQHRRGSEGFGLLMIDNNKIEIKRATEPIKALMDLRFATAPIVLFHHRFPTSTDNDLSQTHPIIIKHPELKYDYYILHNGVISNDNDLLKLHTEELGYTYKTYQKDMIETGLTGRSNYFRDKFNDSEAFSIELARYLENLTKAIGTKGSAAFIAVRVDKNSKTANKLIWGRNENNPLTIMESKSGILIASTIKNKRAFEITENTYQSIDLEKLAKKKPTTKTSSFIRTHKLRFKEYETPTIIEPPPLESHRKRPDPSTTTPDISKPRTLKPDASTSSSVKKNQITDITEEKTIIQNLVPTDYLDDFEIRTQGYNPRMKAFVKMSDRIIRDTWPEVEALCMRMAYGEVSLDDITFLVSDLSDLLLEKEAMAASRIRNHFDVMEQLELNELNKKTPDKTSNEDDERGAEYELYSKQSTRKNRNRRKHRTSQQLLPNPDALIDV